MRLRIKSAYCWRAYSQVGVLAYVALLVGVVALRGLAAGPGAELEQGFREPPEAARPWVYWFVMDGNLSREGITADFEALKRAGIGGVIFMEVDVGIPRGPVRFMSPEWRALFKHAVEEAKRLGLQITLNAGPGWTGSGGPWVKPEQSMQHLVASEVEVAGPRHYDEVLPKPQRRPAFFGDGQLPPDLEKAKNDFYRDEVVLAFPTPEGKERIRDIDEKALYVRAPYSSQPNVKPFMPSLAHYPKLPAEMVVDTNRTVELTGRMGADGRLIWDVPAGRWTIMRFGRTSTGACTRPAPLPGLGLECDKMDPAALDAHFDAFAGTLLREIGTPTNKAGAGWTTLHIDSWEMGAQNWTAGFREEFRRRRGYDPLRYLPAMTGRVVTSPEVTERFLWDLRQTVQELIIQNHAEHLKALGRKHGLALSIEPYDMMPCADMSFGAAADVPMGEFWLSGFDTTYSVIEAASIAHTCGRPIVAAESFTSDDRERWQAYPGAMKVLGDWAFCSGVNRLVIHRCQHQPSLTQRPGMTMGPYGVHWERTETWWDMAGAYHQYLARCQFMLRQGLPVADVCYLVPEGAPQVFRPPSSARLGNPPDRPGYNYDGCTAETLMGGMWVTNGRPQKWPEGTARPMSLPADRKLMLPDGMSYHVLVLPNRSTMTPALVMKIEELVRAGATVVGPPPVKSPSLRDGAYSDWFRGRDGGLWGLGALPPHNERDQAKAGAPVHYPSSLSLPQGSVYWPPELEQPPSEETSVSIRQGKWIWFKEGNPAVSAPVGKRYFRRSFSLEKTTDIKSARVFMTADNSFKLWVNGQEAGGGDNFHQATVLEVKPMLRQGENLLAVAAENGGSAPNPAGLAGEVVVKFKDGREIAVPTDESWQVARNVEGNWTTEAAPAGDWSGALVLGPVGMAPWGAVEAQSREPEQYCDYDVVRAVFQGLGVPPDFESDGPVRYTHRRTADADIYFVANREDRRVEANCTFRVSGKAPELWDPLTGQVRDLPEFTSQGWPIKPSLHYPRTMVPLRFEPGQSFFVVFRKPASVAAGRNFLPEVRLAELSGSWEVSFDPKWGGPQRVEFEKLQDWSQRPEEGIRYYSGMATYRKSFDAPKAPQRQRLYLDLGVVKNLARVRLNGHDLGVVWCAPWRVDTTDAVKAKDNQLEIIVANLWPNRLIGDQALPPDKRLTSTTWNPFTKDSPLLESGLLGPVTLVTESKEAAALPRKAGMPARTVGAPGRLINHDTTNCLVTLADQEGNLVLRLNYNGGCWLDQVKVLGREVVAPEGVYSTIRVSNQWFASRFGLKTPTVSIAGDTVTVSDIAFGGAGFQVRENWKFTVRADRILWQIGRNYLTNAWIEDAPIPAWNFQSMQTWTGGILNDGGVAWNKYLETPNATYGAHAGAVTFWNREEDNCLSIRPLEHPAPGPHARAIRFSHQPSGVQTLAFTVTGHELQPKHELRRFLSSRQDLWAPFDSRSTGSTVTIYSLQATDYKSTCTRGEFTGLNGRSIHELLNTIARYGVIDRDVVGANGWRTGYACLHEQWFSQMGIAIDDPNYLANCAATYDFERDHAVELSGRVKSRWCYDAGDAMAGTYDTNGFYEAQWGYLLDSQPCCVICIAELFDQTGDKSWLRRQKDACEKVLNYLLRRDADGDGLVEMMTDSHTQQRGSDWIDIIWASHENALVNAELYYALTLWADAEEVLGDDAHAAEYRQRAARLKESYNKTTAEGGFWDPQNQWYVYWRDKDGSVHGNNLVTPVNVAAIGYGLCDDAGRREAILRRMEEEMQKEHLFFWPLNFFPYQPDEGHANNFPFPKYENGDIFLSWGELAVRAYAKSHPEIAVKYIKNVLEKYEADGLSFQRYLRQSQRGAGEDILAGNCMPIVGLYRDVYGIQPKHNRLYLEPHLTPELNGTRLNYTLRGRPYVVDLSTRGSSISIWGITLQDTEPFALRVEGDSALFYPGNRSTPTLTVTRSHSGPLEIRIETWPASPTGVRKWSESCAGRVLTLKHVVSDLQPGATYDLRCNGRSIGSFTADREGKIAFDRKFDEAGLLKLELLSRSKAGASN